MIEFFLFQEGAFSGFTSHWFLFDLLIKAIVLELNLNGSLSSSTFHSFFFHIQIHISFTRYIFCCFSLTASRIGRFSKEFKQNIETLVNCYIQEKWVKIPQFPSIIIAIGTFFNKLFKVMERGFVFAVVRYNLRFLPY
jgi:hypothetical protein